MNQSIKAQIAKLLKLLEETGFKLDLTSNGDYTRCYIKNDWRDAYNHITSTNKASIIAISTTESSLRIFYDCSQNSDELSFEFSSQDPVLEADFENLQIKVKLTSDCDSSFYSKSHA